MFIPQKWLQHLAFFVLAIFLTTLFHLPTWGQSPPILYQQALSLWQAGQTQQAISEWKQAIQGTSDQSLKARAYLMLAQAYLDLGFIHLADSAFEKGKSLRNTALTTFIKAIEGNLALAKRDFEGAISAYEDVPNSLGVLNNLSQAYEQRARLRQQLAQEAYLEGDEEQERLKIQGTLDLEKAKLIAQNAISQASKEVSLDAAKSWIRWSQLGADEGVKQALEILKQLPDSFDKGLQLLEIAQLDRIGLPVAESVAQTLNHSFLLAQVERLYAQDLEKETRYEKAIQHTLKAYRLVAQSNLELLGQLQWDLGRLYNRTNADQKSLKYYRQAILSNETIRKQLASATRNVQLNYQRTTDKLYREFFSVLFKNPSQKILKEVILLKQKLHLSQLESYFGNPCKISETQAENPHTNLEKATIYTIILDSSLHEIIELPHGEYLHQTIQISQEKLESLIRQWRLELEDEFTFDFLTTAEQLYDWLIKPWTEKLQGIKTLVFVNDGVLWSVPMSALWKGQYLIESYQVAYSLGLEESKNKTSQELFPVLFGTTQTSKAFKTPLPFVKEEIKKIREIVGGNAYLDERFSLQQFNLALNSEQYTILHLASHAKFSSFEKSFIQTGTGLLSLEELEKLLQTRKAPLQLLTLSGCQTAAGNDRSIYGIAGVGIRANIPSVLGTIWFVDDSTTSQLMINFYRIWKEKASPLEALRQSQLQLIQSPSGSHPRFWSAFLFLTEGNSTS